MSDVYGASNATGADPEGAGVDALATDPQLPAADQQLQPPARPLSEQEQRHRQLLSWIDNPNIADELEDDVLQKIGQLVIREYKIDESSRDEWLTDSRAAMDLAMQVAKEKTFPWPKASNVIYPLIGNAAQQFAARAYPAIVAGRDVVKGVVSGKDDGKPQMAPDGTPAMQVQADGSAKPIWVEPPGSKRARADRIGGHMSWQLIEEQPEWEEETDKLLHILPIVGCEFRKSYFDPSLGRNVSVRVGAADLVINYHAKSIERAPRITEKLKLYPIEIEEHERAGTFLKNEDGYGPAPDAKGDDDAPLDFLEQHRWYDLDDDGYPEPYICTVHEQSGKVARIVARYDADGIMLSRRTGEVQRIKPVQYYTKFDFLPNPDGGIYGVGFGKLLKPINEAINTTLNQMFDAGTLANTQAGFIGKGLSMHSGSLKWKMGEFKVVPTAGSAIRDAIVQLQFPGPSTVLFSLLGLLIEAGKEITAANNVLSGDVGGQNMQPTTLLALIEQGLKVFASIYKRVHRALKNEYDKLYRLNRVYGEERSTYQVGDEWREIRREDYEKGSGVAPVSDPAMVSDMQKMGRVQFLLSFKDDPLCDGVEIRRRAFEGAQIEEIDSLFAKAQGPDPMTLLLGKELEIKEQNGRATRIKDLALAVRALAEADKFVGDQHVVWIETQLRMLEMEFEAHNAANEQAGAAAAGQRSVGGGLPELAAASGQQGAAAVPA